MAKAREKVEKHPFINWFWPDNDIALGELAKGYVYLDKNSYQEAERSFADADRDFFRRHYYRWPAAYDAMAILDIEKAKHDFEKKNYVDSDAEYNDANAQSQRADGFEMARFGEHYNSAIYHLAQSYDEKAREIFNSKDDGMICKAFTAVNKAMEIYK